MKLIALMLTLALLTLLVSGVNLWTCSLGFLFVELALLALMILTAMKGALDVSTPIKDDAGTAAYGDCESAGQ